jgi:type II secretory pathway pseudopilin PulG
MPTGRLQQGGFAYVMLLVSIALIGVAASASLSLGATIARRDVERELLAVGLEIQQSLYGYAGITGTSPPATSARGPRHLDELLKDSRVPGIRRHLRQLYTDPLTGRNEWGVVRDAQGYIVGVYSLADGKPIRRIGFEPSLPHFEEAENYGQCVFGFPSAVAPKLSPR